MNTNDAYGTNTADIATTGNVAYMTTGDAIPASQNVAYGQVPPGTDVMSFNLMQILVCCLCKRTFCFTLAVSFVITPVLLL